MVPTDPTKPDAKSISAKITATNYVHWRADYATGDQVRPLTLTAARCSLICVTTGIIVVRAVGY
jgi:hypothetical protein